MYDIFLGHLWIYMYLCVRSQVGSASEYYLELALFKFLNEWILILSQMYCTALYLYSATWSAHQPEALPVRKTQREESKCGRRHCIFLIRLFKTKRFVHPSIVSSRKKWLFTTWRSKSNDDKWHRDHYSVTVYRLIHKQAGGLRTWMKEQLTVCVHFIEHLQCIQVIPIGLPTL